MHESRLVADLIEAAERSVAGDPAAITSIRLRIGALAPATPHGLAEGMKTQAALRWRTTPRIDVIVAKDPTASGAADVELVSLRVAD